MRITLVRHGHYRGNEPLLKGQIVDDAWVQAANRAGLSDLGRSQAGALASKLGSSRIDAIYSSPLQRALETAASISSVSGVTPEIWDDLAEVPPFTYPGAPPEYRCDEEANHRTARAVEDRLWAIHGGTNDQVLLVTHGGFVSTFLSSALRLGPCGYHRFTCLGNCGSVTVMLDSPGKAKIDLTPV